jgi:Sec-independent protein secretion pathway component TatC
MGLLEMLLVVLAAAGGALGLALWVLLSRRSPAPETAPRAPLPLLALLFAFAWVLLSPLLGFGLGGLLLEQLVPEASSLEWIAVGSPGDALAARLLGGALLAAWFVLPGLLAAAWLLASRLRRWTSAWGLGGLGWLGFGAGLALGHWVVLPRALDSLVAVGPELHLGLLDLAWMSAKGMGALGVAGATLPVLWMLAASSHRALQLCVAATALMPVAALLLSALCTPPDVLSQLLLATLMGMSWLFGLAGGAVTSRVAAREQDGSR